MLLLKGVTCISNICTKFIINQTTRRLTTTDDSNNEDDNYGHTSKQY